MDKFEEHIRKHREEMDTRKPPAEIWKGISRQAGIGRRGKHGWLSVAAMVTIVIGSGLLYFHAGSRWTGRGNKDKDPAGRSAANIQLRETEIYYNNLANTLYMEASPLLVKNPEMEKELSADMTHLDSLCADIRKDLKDNVANQDVIEALIRNYRIRIRILEEMLNVLKVDEKNSQKR